SLRQPESERVLRQDIDQHIANLPHQVNGLVEGQDQVTLGKLDLLANLDHGGAEAPGSRRTIKRAVMPLGYVESVVPLFTQDGMFEVFQPPAERDELGWQREMIGVAEI